MAVVIFGLMDLLELLTVTVSDPGLGDQIEEEPLLEPTNAVPSGLRKEAFR